MAADIEAYLQKKAAEIAKAGVPVILDWGFWQRARREEAEAYFRKRGVETEWYYVEVTDEEWQRNIRARNEAVTKGETNDYFVDEGLFQKIVSRFEPPAPGEMPVIRNPK